MHTLPTVGSTRPDGRRDRSRRRTRWARGRMHWLPGGVLLLMAALTSQVFVAPAASAAPSPVTPTGPVPPGTQFAQADGTVDRTLRDLGMSTGLSDGRRLWAFGDTFEWEPPQSGVHPDTAAFT